MATVYLMKASSGAFVPASEQDAEAMRRFKVGGVQKAEITEMRNGRFFRKWWVLVQFAYGIWAETMPKQQWRGHDVLPNFDKFRKDLTILCGHFHAVWNIRGEMKVEPDSLSWSSMSEETFDQLYSKTIEVILSKVIPKAGMTEEVLRETVDRLMCDFA